MDQFSILVTGSHLRTLSSSKINTLGSNKQLISPAAGQPDDRGMKMPVKKAALSSKKHGANNL
jgi:hypothetical protein